MFQYLYQAEFADGTLINQPQLNQNHLDVSELDPTKSLFHDVQVKEKEDGLLKFRLKPQFFGPVYELDMKTGKVNGLAIFQDNRVIDTPLRLVYFRRTTRAATSGGGEIKKQMYGIALFSVGRPQRKKVKTFKHFSRLNNGIIGSNHLRD